MRHEGGVKVKGESVRDKALWVQRTYLANLPGTLDVPCGARRSLVQGPKPRHFLEYRGLDPLSIACGFASQGWIRLPLHVFRYHSHY